MRRDFTQRFIQYRETARLIWNLGFWPNPDLREVACVLAYEDARARLFEGMVLLSLGYQQRVKEWPGRLGEFVNFEVTTNVPGAELKVDPNLPDACYHVWGDPVVRLNSDSYRLKFMDFHDWYQLAPRDFRFLEVLIERLDERRDLVGHLALIELEKCSIWFVDDGDQHESA